MKKIALIISLLFATFQAQAAVTHSLLVVSEASRTVIVQSTDDVKGTIYFSKCETTNILDKSLAEATTILNSDQAVKFYNCVDSSKPVFIIDDMTADAFNQSFFSALVETTSSDQNYRKDVTNHLYPILLAMLGSNALAIPFGQALNRTGTTPRALNSREVFMGRAATVVGILSLLGAAGMEAWFWNNTRVEQVAFEKKWNEIVDASAVGIAKQGPIDQKLIDDLKREDSKEKAAIINDIFRALQLASTNLRVSA